MVPGSNVQVTRFEVVSLLLTFIAILLIPGVAFLIRGAMKWTRVEDQLENLMKDVKDLVEDKDRVHNAMIEQMKDDRRATDRRLRWLEEHVWHKA